MGIDMYIPSQTYPYVRKNKLSAPKSTFAYGPIVVFFVNYHLLQKEASLMRDDDVVIYGYNKALLE